jgi:hypothetical protein
MQLLCFTGSGDNCNAYNVYKNRLNYLFPFALDIKPPIMLIFLALLAAEQCVALKLATDPLSRASQRCQILLPASLPAQTAGTEIGCLSYTMSVALTLNLCQETLLLHPPLQRRLRCCCCCCIGGGRPPATRSDMEFPARFFPEAGSLVSTAK